MFSASATIFLKRGETWKGSLSLPADNLTIDTYGQGVTPVLDGSVAVTIITDVGAGVYAYDASLAADEGLGHIADSAGILKFVAWQSDVSATLSAAVTGSYAYDYASSRVWV